MPARLQILLAAVLFSTGGAAIKACSYGGWQVAGLRSAIAAAALALALPAVRKKPSRADLLIALAYAATVILFVLANKLTTSANAIFLQSTAPLYLLLLGPLLLHEPLRWRDAPFLAVLALGLTLVFLSEEAPRATAPDPLLGNLLALASGVAFALLLAGLRWSEARGGGGPRSVLWGNVLAAAIALPMALPLPPPALGDALALGFLGLVQIALAYTLVLKGLSRVGALEASLLLLAEPALNPLWSWAAHGEVPGDRAIAGGALILAATLVRALGPARGTDR